MFGNTPEGSLVDAFASHIQTPSLLTSRHSQKEAYKQAVHDAWENGNNMYTAAAKARRQQRGQVVQQGLTASPLQPGLSQLGFNSGGHASLALRPGMPALPTSVNAPALAPNPNAPGLPQNPLGFEMGRGSSMYAKGIPNNGMPDMWSSTCLAQGEFAGTYKDPITGITYAMVTEPVMEGVSSRDVHAVYERNKPSRALETLTGVPASNVLVPQPKEQYADPRAVYDTQPPLPSQISEYVRSRQTQAAILQSFDAGGTEQMYGLQEDGVKDGMLGTTYILRPRYDTQTLMDNNETNTGVMNRFPNPNTDGSNIEFQDPRRNADSRPVFYMARPKPSLPTRTHLDLDDGIIQGPRQEISDRLQRQMTSLPTRTQVNLEDTNPARQDVYDRLPQGRDTIMLRAPDAMDVTALTRVPLISEHVYDSTAALLNTQTVHGVESDVYGSRQTQISEHATARDADVLHGRQELGDLNISNRGGLAFMDSDDARDGRRASTVQRIEMSADFTGNRALATADGRQGYDAKIALSMPRISIDRDGVSSARNTQTTDSGQGHDGKIAHSMPRISIDNENVGASTRDARASDSGQGYDAKIARIMPRIFADDEGVGASTRDVRFSDGGQGYDAKIAQVMPRVHGDDHNAISARGVQTNDGERGYDVRVARIMPRVSVDEDAVASSRNTQANDGGYGYDARTARMMPRISVDEDAVASTRNTQANDGGYGYDARVARMMPRITVDEDAVASARDTQANDGEHGYDARIVRMMPRVSLDEENATSARNVQSNDGGQIHDAKVARMMSRVSVDQDSVPYARDAQANDGEQGNDAKVARMTPRISLDQDSHSRNTQADDGSNMSVDRLAGNRQGGQYLDGHFRSGQHAGVQDGSRSGEHAHNRQAGLYPTVDLGGSWRAFGAADGDMGEDASIAQGRQQVTDAATVSARLIQVGEANRVRTGAISRSSLQVDTSGSHRGSGNSMFVHDGGLGSHGKTSMPFALPKIDGFVLGNRAAAVQDNVAREMVGSRPGAIMHLRPVLDDADNLGQVRVVFADSSRSDMANPIAGEHAFHGYDLANTLSQFKPMHHREDYAPMQTDRHGLIIINPEIERDATNPANIVRDYHTMIAYRKSQEANANKNPVMCMTRESYETDAYDTDG